MWNLRAVTFASLLLIAIAVGCSSSDQAAIDKAVNATIAAAQPPTGVATATPEAAIDKAVSPTLAAVFRFGES